MAGMTRRKFISTVGAVTGAAAMSAAAPEIVRAAVSASEGTAIDDPHAGPIVAYVKQPTSGQVELMVGDREVTVTDRVLVKRIVTAAR
jgi:hypothetical protein